MTRPVFVGYSEEFPNAARRGPSRLDLRDLRGAQSLRHCLQDPSVGGRDAEDPAGFSGRQIDRCGLPRFEHVIAEFAVELAGRGIGLDSSEQVRRSSPFCHSFCLAYQGSAYSAATVAGVDGEQMQLSEFAVDELEQAVSALSDGLIVFVDAAGDEGCTYRLLLHGSEQESPAFFAERLPHVCFAGVGTGVANVRAEDSMRLLEVSISRLFHGLDFEARRGLIGAIAVGWAKSNRLGLIKVGTVAGHNVHESSPYLSGQVLVTPGRSKTVTETTDALPIEGSPGVGVGVGASGPHPFPEGGIDD